MKKIFVTEPFLPDLDEYIPYLKEIWENKQLTNNGPLHNKLEDKLAKFLGVKYISLFNNATNALLIALKVLNLKGEIITTPFSFVATSHVIEWNKLKPVFVDIEPNYCNIDYRKIEDAITSKTSAIMPVHVYGNPCDDKNISKIAQKYNLKTIYDAAHAFDVKYKNNSILNYGDLSVLSFHATKVFNTFEGGAIVSQSKDMKIKIDQHKNFGFTGETSINGIGINGKMNELQAAMGLVQLNHIKSNINKRREIFNLYFEGISKLNGIKFLDSYPDLEYNYAYMPIFIDEQKFGKSRDQVYNELKKINIYCRRYFYPLISSFNEYKNIKSFPKHLPCSHKISKQVLCLPIYSNLEQKYIDSIIKYFNN